MKYKSYVIKSDKEGYFHGLTGESDGSFYFTNNIINSKLYDNKKSAIDDIKDFDLDSEYFNSYIVSVSIDIEELEKVEYIEVVEW